MLPSLFYTQAAPIGLWFVNDPTQAARASMLGPQAGPPTGKRGAMKNIYVGNLTFDATEDQVRGLFEAYGPVEKVSIITDRDTGQPRGFAFVEMTDDESAGKAMEALNGTNLGGRNLTVNEARPKADRPRRDGGGGGGGRGGYGGGRGRSGGGGNWGRY